MPLNRETLNIVLSAIVPVGGFPNGDLLLRKWATCRMSDKIEVIFVVDSNDEKVLSTIEEIVSGNEKSNIKILTSQSRNPGSTRQIGLNAAEGHWVCFWDADDLPEIESIMQTIEEVENDNFDILIGSYRRIDHKNSTSLEFRQNSEDALFRIFLNPGLWRVIFRRELVKDLAFPALRMGEDQVFLFRALSLTERIRFVNKVFYNYYLYETGQLTKTDGVLNDLLESKALCQELYLHNPSSNLLASIIRQNLTLIKRGKLNIKLRSAVAILKFSAQGLSYIEVLLKVLGNLRAAGE